MMGEPETVACLPPLPPSLLPEPQPPSFLPPTACRPLLAAAETHLLLVTRRSFSRSGPIRSDPIRPGRSFPALRPGAAPKPLEGLSACQGRLDSSHLRRAQLGDRDRPTDQPPAWIRPFFIIITHLGSIAAAAAPSVHSDCWRWVGALPSSPPPPPRSAKRGAQPLWPNRQEQNVTWIWLGKPPLPQSMGQNSFAGVVGRIALSFSTAQVVAHARHRSPVPLPSLVPPFGGSTCL